MKADYALYAMPARSELFYGAHQGSVASCTKAVAKGARLVKDIELELR